MNEFLLPTSSVFQVQVAISLVVLGCLTRWYLWPFLQAQPVTRSLQWLLLPCVAHHVGIGTLFTNAVPPASSPSFALLATVGDSAVMVMALGLQNALYRGLSSARVWAWAFTVVGFTYNLYGLTLQLSSYINGLGPHYYVIAFYVPVLGLAHFLVAVTLITRGAELMRPGIGRLSLAT